MYRILSPTAILGYGFPVSSFEKAMDLKLDLIAADAGSVDAGPYYLGSGQPYMGKTALKQDLEIMILHSPVFVDAMPMNFRMKHMGLFVRNRLRSI